MNLQEKEGEQFERLNSEGARKSVPSPALSATSAQRPQAPLPIRTQPRPPLNDFGQLVQSLLGKQYSPAGSLSISPKGGVAGARRTGADGAGNRLGEGTEIQDFGPVHWGQSPMSLAKLENPFQAFRPLSLPLFL